MTNLKTHYLKIKDKSTQIKRKKLRNANRKLTPYRKKF